MGTMQVEVQQHSPDPSLQVDETSAAFLSRVVGLVPGIIYVFNHKTKSNEYSNRSMAELLGYTSDEVIAMGDTLVERVVHEDDLPGLVAYFDSMAELLPGDYSSHEYRDYAKDGSIVWLRSIDTVFERAEDGSVVRHIGIAFDISAEKEATEELQRVNRELERRVQARTAELRVVNRDLAALVAERTAELRDVNRDLENLTYVATHDLRVPVNNLSSLTHMLQEEAAPLLPPEHVETLDWMRDVSDQASEKLDALICVAQAHSGALQDFEAVNLAQVTERALVNLHFQISRARAVIHTAFDQPTVWFVPREMENILQSMIGNAIKYHAPGRRPRINLLSRQLDTHVEVSIRDNGTGLDLPRDAEKVFGLFKRAHSTPEGAGVSLYSIRRVLERVGGSIDVSSTPGVGSCFSIRLPNPPEGP
ncbi:PAS domain-containing sensor histidine kinase [uncultured Roseobacter sp.]|uniref:sensor histidine kinase n=1 Tax=uncultured Roseobacter sp. TaxID=114847 RepID=UPI00261084D3|nr:PAS domain-containing sensor histidine kinase [uncultured Roseobacter sp.]